MSTDAKILGVNEKKRRVAKCLIQQAATMVEFWGEMGDPAVDWDLRLNEPRPAAPPDQNGEP